MAEGLDSPPLLDIHVKDEEDDDLFASAVQVRSVYLQWNPILQFLSSGRACNKRKRRKTT